MTIPQHAVTIPRHFWLALISEFAKHGSAVERVAYFDGYLTDMAGYPDATPVAVVAALVLPDARLAPGNYEVSATAMSQAGSHLRARRMTRLAQIHTHGNDWVDHSHTDDAHAYSQRIGSLSIVMPRHAITNPTLDECGVHVRTAVGWQRLTSAETQSYVRIEPSLYDYRNPACLEPTSQSIGTFSLFRRWLTALSPLRSRS